MADLKLVGAVAIKVRPNAKGFKKETEDQIKDQLKTLEAKVKVRLETDPDDVKKDVAAAKKEAEKQKWSMKVGLDYESVIKAEKELNRAIKGLEAQKIAVTLDDEGIIEARGMLAEMAEGAQIEMTYVQDEKGYQQVLDKIANIRRQKLEEEITFGFSEAELLEKEREMKALLAESAFITVSYNNDRASIEKALAQVKAEQEKIEAVTFDVLMNPESLDTAAEILQAVLAATPVKLKVNYDDQASLKATRDKLQSMLSDVLSTELEVLVNEDDIKAKLAEINDLIEEEVKAVKIDTSVAISYNNNRPSIQAAINQINKELDKIEAVKLDIELDPKQLREKRAELEMELRATPIEVEYRPDMDGYNSILSQIAELQRPQEIPFQFALDQQGLTQQAVQMRQMLYALNKDNIIALEIDQQAKNKVEQDMQTIQNSLDGLNGTIDVGLVGSEQVAARLAFLGRDRIVTFFANVNERSLAVAGGALKSLGGLNTLGDAAQMLENLFTRFDQVAMKASNIAVTIGSLANVLVAATTSVFSIGQGVTQSLGLLAAAPAILGAATVGYTIFTAAFNNFFDAFNKDPKIAESALAALPPIARKTVDSITGLYKGLANPIQEKFWEHMGGTLAETIETLYPSLKEKLLESTEAVGDFVGGMAKSFNKLALSDDFDRMFAGFNGFFKNLSGASEPFFDAWNKFGVQGAQLLPQFGTWLTNLAVQFDNWATKMSANGGIAEMIMHGVHSLQNMWDIGVSVTDMFGAIARAAGLAGAGGLSQFNVTMRRIADQMNGEPWQSKAALIFEGARKGASGLMDGFRDLGKTVGDSAGQFGYILELLGKIGGAVITNFSQLFDVEDFQTGITAGLEGMLTMFTDLKPAARDLGGMIGNLATIAGAVFANLAPSINRLFDTVGQAVEKLTDNLIKVAPKLSNTFGAIFAAITPPLLLLVDGLNLILGTIGKIPDSFVVAGVALTAFFALRALASKFYESVSGSNYFKTLESNWVNQQVAAGKTIKSFQLVDGELKKISSIDGKFNPTVAAFKDLNDHAGNFTGGIRNMYQLASYGEQGLSPLRSAMATTAAAGGSLIKAAGSGLMGALGGPWGLAIAAAAVGIGIFAQSQSDAKANVDDLSRAIDAQSGIMNEAGLKKIALRWTDLGEAGDNMANLARGSKAANETAKLLNLNFADVTKTIAAGGQPAKDLADKISRLGSAMGALEGGNRAGRGMETLRQEAAIAAEAIGLTVDKIAEMDLKPADFEHLAKNIREEAAMADLARIATEGLANAQGTSTVAAGQMAAAMQQIGDRSLDASSKIGSINKALDLLKNGGKMSAQEAEANAQTAFQNSIKQAEALREELAGNTHLIDETTKLLDLTSTSGLGLYNAMKQSADGIKIQAQAAYDAVILNKGTPEQAAAAAQKVIETNAGVLDAIAQKAGVSKDVIAAQWESFFGTKWELQAVFSARADEFMAVRQSVQDAGLEWSESVWESYLKANGDGAKADASTAAEWIKDVFVKQQYDARLGALPQDAQAVLAGLLGEFNAYKTGDYTALLKALNAAGPGVAATLETLRQVPPEKLTIFKAQLENGMYNSVAAQLNLLANPRLVSFGVTMTDELRDMQMAGRGRNGAIVNGLGRGLHGFGLEPVKYFANGGIERHVAQIASGRGPVRVWGERETQGEAYIPYAQSKRPRSLNILTQVAKDFGYELTKAQQFADGGLAGHTGPSTTNTASVTIGTLVTTDADAAVRKIRTSQQDALAVAGITLNGA